MRKLVLPAVVLGLLVAAAALAWHFVVPDPWASLEQELKDPASAWAQSLRPETALTDLARFEQAPAYRVDLEYIPNERRLTGKQEVLYTNLTGKPLDKVYAVTMARAWGDAEQEDDRFALSDVKVNGAAVETTMGKYYAPIPLKKPLSPGMAVRISFEFTAKVPYVARATSTAQWDWRDNPGSYGVNPRLADGLGAAIPVIVTDASVYDNLTDQGALANPTFALWDVRLTLPSHWRAISSGTAVGEEDRSNGRKATRIISPSYTFYLFASGSLEAATREVDGVRVIVHHPKEYAELGKSMLEETSRLLEAHQAAMGPYPYRELEILPVNYAAPVGGESRSGLVIIHANFVQNDRTWEAPASVTDPWLRSIMQNGLAKQRRETLAHELGHSWWGDLVWFDVFRAPAWMEGMTEALGIAALEKGFGMEQAEARRSRQTYSYRYLRWKGTPDLSIGQPVSDLSRLRDYMAMSYAKPALFYDKVRRDIGDEAFFGALRRYVERERFSIRTDRGPIEELMSVPGMAALYRHWLEEAHGDDDLGRLSPEQEAQLRSIQN